MRVEPIRLGVLGDTHGRAETCRAAIAVLREAGATRFCHTGDVGEDGRAQAVLDELAGTGCRFVWGNNDYEDRSLADYATDLGLICGGDWHRFDLDRLKVVLTHGDDLRGLRRLEADAASGRERVDLLLTGHSHVPHDRAFPGGGRWINPGALHRARPRTCCLLRIDDDGIDLESFEID
jgi:putative phosphoesterase